jgi:5'-AMP-activated protein kinase catalytic alpha subunit
LEENEAAHYFYQLVLAIEYLALNGISHRDIKPENILIDSHSDIKLIDFGLGKPYSPGELIKTACGSPCYAAPEMVARKHYRGDLVDIWSSGITLFAMLCGTRVSPKVRFHSMTKTSQLFTRRS